MSSDAAWIAGTYPTSDGEVVLFGEYGSTEYDLIAIESLRIEELVTAIAFSPENDRFVIGGDNGNLRMWTVSDYEYHSFIRGERSTTSNRVNAIAFSPTEPVLATAESDPQGVVRIFDAVTLQQKQATVLPNSVAAKDLVFSPDGSQIAVLVGNTVLILDSASLEPIAQLVAQWNQ
jgi:WD40 repeat protein